MVKKKSVLVDEEGDEAPPLTLDMCVNALETEVALALTPNGKKLRSGRGDAETFESYKTLERIARHMREILKKGAPS